VYIDEADGCKRPLGVPALEDKIVQRATVEVLNAIYEQDFLGFSYGFRPRRSAHQALDAVAVGVSAMKVNWILDADISKFFAPCCMMQLSTARSCRMLPERNIGTLSGGGRLAAAGANAVSLSFLGEAPWL
jgi:hypothetical protein